MKVKNLQTAARLLAEIHEIDKEIISLEKKGAAIMNSEKFINIQLSFDTPKLETDADPNGDFPYTFMINLRSPFASFEPAQKENFSTEKLSFKLSDNETLFIIDALLRAKNQQRKKLVEQIYGLGVSL